MALRDPNVLNRVNALNTNLENANIAEIEMNVSKRLFNVLEWANNISIDPELYASINDVANSSNIANFINNEKNNLPHNAADQITINYSWWPYNIANTIVNLAPAAWITETQNAINDMNNAIAWLNILPNQINTLRVRLEENRRILNEIYNIQSDWRWTGRAAADINLDITNETWNRDICQNLLNILSGIQATEQHPAYLNTTHAQHTFYTTLHTNQVNNFNTTIVGIPWVTNYTTDGDFVNKRNEVTTAKTNYNNHIRNLEQELNLSNESSNNINRLQTWTIAVPLNFWLFNTNDTIVNRAILTNAANTQTEINNIDGRLSQLDILHWQIDSLRTRYQANLNRLNRILALQNLEQRTNTTHPGELLRRQNEFNTIRDISHNNLLLWNLAYVPDIPDQNTNVWWTLWPINLNFINWTLWTWFNGWARSHTYSLCDENWNPLRNNWWRLEIQHWWQTILLWWVVFNNAAQTLTINNLTTTPIEWITFPLNLDLNVRVRVHDDDTRLDIDLHKPIHLEITRPTLDVHLDREPAYDSLIPPMNDRIQAEYSDHYRENLENEAIWRILREGWNDAEVNEIYNDERRRKILQNRMRSLINRYFPVGCITLADLQTGFRIHTTTRNDVPAQYLVNQRAFSDYVRHCIPDNLREYTSDRIYQQINNTIRTELLQELINFQADVANNPVDNYDNLRAMAMIPNDNQWPQWHPNNFWQRIRGRRSRKNNYTKFFQWREASLYNQTLETEEWTIKYGVHVEVQSTNKITATINIDWKNEPEIIDAANHDRLIRWILNRANTKDWEPLNRKLRCNIALSVLKAMVMMSPQTLSREIPPMDFRDNEWNTIRCDRIEAYIEWWNLRLRGWIVNNAWPTRRTRRNADIFDESSFKSLHDVNMLENGVRQLSTQVNSIMNATANEYNEATNTILRNKSLRTYDTTQFLRFWPAKRLRWRMVYWKTNNDFNFETSVNDAWKSVNIMFNKWLFTVSWQFDWQEYQYQWKDLWLILRKKINRKRVFDGIELSMVSAINEEYIQRLRTNHFIQTENFAVLDTNANKTWRIYIFDEWWDLSYLDIEDRWLNPLGGRNAWRIDPNAIPAERIRCNAKERKEFFQNPFLSWRLIRTMRRRLALY